MDTPQSKGHESEGRSGAKRPLLDQVRNAARSLHYSLRTEEAYVNWVKRFILFHGKRHPSEMGRVEVETFLSDLAIRRKVAASTQNQALAAILFLYREVLSTDLPWLTDVTRAKRPERLPTILNVLEVQKLLSNVDGVPGLVVKLLYGTGMRLMEGLRLRVKDVDIASRQIVVREGKGNKDRVTVLPDSLIVSMKDQLRRRKEQFDRDAANGLNSVYLPDALAVKYPNAGREWGWQFVFASASLSRDPRGGEGERRHHLDENTIQRCVKRASQMAGINKPVSPHVLRHYVPSRTMSRC